MHEKHQVMKKITLTPRRGYVKPPEIEHHFDEPEYFSYERVGELLYRQTMSISNINLNDWTVTVEADYTDKFKKVASVVGKELAGEVLDALDREVPDYWDSEYDEGHSADCCG